MLDRKPDNFFAEAEQAAFGTGVLVDGIDLEEAKALASLPGKPAPGESRPASPYTRGAVEASEPHETTATDRTAAQ